MGALVILRYPAFFGRSPVDHTYVMCGTGRRAWSCWGGKTGGTPLRMGSGSTRQANAIAGLDERAGITCYGVNGVCHQAANRVAFPARILALGARGYGLSEALFGPYGRERGPFGLCKAPFEQHAGVTGDLDECAEPTEPAGVRDPAAAATRGPTGPERIYLDRVLEIYGRVSGRVRFGEALSAAELEEFDVALFLNKVQFNLGGERQGMLEGIYRDFDRERIRLEGAFANHEIGPSAFATEFNHRAAHFQEKIAGSLSAAQHEALLDLKPGEFGALLDPDFVEQVYKRT